MLSRYVEADGEGSIRGARKNGGRKSRLMSEGFSSKLPKLWFWNRREERPPPEGKSGGGARTGRSARYSPSPQPSDLRDPQAGFAGARPSGKGEKSRGKRY